MDIVMHGPTEIWNERGSWARIAFLALVEPKVRDAREHLFHQREPIAPYFHEPDADSESHGTQLQELWEWLLDSEPIDPGEYVSLAGIMVPERPFDLWTAQEQERSLHEDNLPWIASPAPYTQRSLDLAREARQILERCPSWMEDWITVDPLTQMAVYIATGATPQIPQAKASATGKHLIEFVGPFHSYEKITIEVFDPVTTTGEDVKRLYEAATHEQHAVHQKLERSTEELAVTELRLVVRKLEALLREGISVDPLHWEWRPNPKELAAELRRSGHSYFTGKLTPQRLYGFHQRVGFWRYRAAIEQTVLGFQQYS